MLCLYLSSFLICWERLMLKPEGDTIMVAFELPVSVILSPLDAMSVLSFQCVLDVKMFPALAVNSNGSVFHRYRSDPDCRVSIIPVDAR